MARFKVPSGDGSCVCEVCDCTPTLEIQTVPLATLVRDGWNGWGDGACKVYKSLAAACTRDGTITVESETHCEYVITGHLEYSASFTIGPAGDHYHCASVTGSWSVTTSGTAEDGGCRSVSETWGSDISCSDFSGFTNSAPIVSPDPYDGLTGIQVGWPAGCNVASADWPYPFWRIAFLTGSGAALATIDDCDGGGEHFILTKGSTSDASSDWAMDESSTASCGSLTLIYDDHGTVTVTLSDEFTVADLLDQVTTAGSDDGSWVDGGTAAISSLSADSLTATYSALRYRFYYAPHACTVTYRETSTETNLSSGTVIGTTASDGTLDLPAETGGADVSDWFTIFPPVPDPDTAYSVSPSILSARCRLTSGGA